MKTDEYWLVQTDQEILEILACLKESKPKWVALDTETTGVNWHDRMVGFSIAWKEGGELKSAYVPVGHPAGLFSSNCSIVAAKRLMAELVTNRPLLFHNALFDMRFIKSAFGLVPKVPYFDSLIVARLFNLESGWEKEGRPSLSLVDLWGRHTDAPEELWRKYRRGKGIRAKIGSKPPEFAAAYAENDARMTYELAEKLLPITREERNDVLWEREREFTNLTFRICDYGLLLNRAKAIQWGKQFRDYQVGLLKYLYREGFVDPRPTSHQKVANYLYGYLKLDPLGFTETGNPSTKVDYLRPYEHQYPQVAAILQYRQYEKAITSWLLPLLELAQKGDGRIHPDLDPAGTVSSRMACREPNLQAIPMKDDRNLVYGSLRGLFAAPEDAVLLEFDYGQADLRMATCYASDNVMAQAFRSVDPYIEMGKTILRRENISSLERFWAKQTVLGALNWVTAEGLVKHGNLMKLGVGEDLTLEQAEDLIARFKEHYPLLVKAGYNAKHSYDRHEHIALWTGRRLKLGAFENSSVAWSRVVQGGVAEMVKEAMLKVDRLLRQQGSRSQIVLQIHDSIILEFYKEDKRFIPVIKELMEKVLPEGIRRRTNPAIEMKVDVERWDK